MIQLSELTKTFGDRVLFDHVTWQITDRERVGLCGPNGAGKTTLLKMMAGLDEPDEGAILKPAALTVGYLPQDGLSHAGRTVFEEASSAFGELLAMKAEMHALEERLGDDSIPEAEHEAMLHRYSDLQDHFRIHDGYSIELKTATVLQGLGFKSSDFERPTETFSGGWQMRIALAKLLLGEPNLLLQVHRGANAVVLNFTEFGGIDDAACERLERLTQTRRAEQTADGVGAKRWAMRHVQAL